MALSAPRASALALAALFCGLQGACKSYPYAQKTPDDLLADAVVDIRDGKGSAALAKLDYLKTKFPDFRGKEAVEFRTAEAERVNGKLWRSFVAFKEFFDHYPVTSRFYTELEDNIYVIGTQLIQSRWSLFGLGIMRDADDGVRVLEYFVDNFRSSPRADEALRQIAEYKYEVGEYEGAIQSYRQILNGPTASVWRDQAEFRIAIAHLRAARRPDLDQKDLRDARDYLQSYLQTRPEGSRREEAKIALRECDEKLAESEYKIGEFYRVIGEPFGALTHYGMSLTNYPGTRFARESEIRIGELGPLRAAKVSADASASGESSR